MNILNSFYKMIGKVKEVNAQVSRIIPFEHFDEFPFYQVFFYGEDREVYRWITDNPNIAQGDQVSLTYRLEFCYPAPPNLLPHGVYERYKEQNNPNTHLERIKSRRNRRIPKRIQEETNLMLEELLKSVDWEGLEEADRTQREEYNRSPYWQWYTRELADNKLRVKKMT